MADIIVDSEFKRKQKDGNYKVYHPITKAKNVKVTVPGIDGTEVETVLKNLFQYADSGKKAVANAVTAKGVSASPTDTFSVLANKIGQINTGKKWASGIAEIQNGPGIAVTVRGLTFTPHIVLAANDYSSDMISWDADTRKPYEQSTKGYITQYGQWFPDGFTYKTGTTGGTYFYKIRWIAFE